MTRVHRGSDKQGYTVVHFMALVGFHIEFFIGEALPTTDQSNDRISLSYGVNNTVDPNLGYPNCKIHDHKICNSVSIFYTFGLTLIFNIFYSIMYRTAMV